MTTSPRLIDELDALHASYVSALNSAIDAGDHRSAEELAEEYDREAIVLMAKHEGRQDLLAHFGLDRDGRRLTTDREAPLRRLVKSLSARRAA